MGTFDGTVSGEGTTYNRIGGLYGRSGGGVTIDNCRISVNIKGGAWSVGGVGGESYTTIRNTVYDGKLECPKSGAGFIGWSTTDATIENCVFDPQDGSYITKKEDEGDRVMGPFYRYGNSDAILTNCYYLTSLGDAQGKQARTITAGSYINISGGGSLANPTTNSPTLTMPAANVTINVIYSASNSITGYTSGADGWYLISSPMNGTVNPTSVTNMLSNTYDLFRFNQNAEMEWQNYKAHNSDPENPFNVLVSGQGYLYANSNNVTLTFVGTPYSGNGVVNLEYSTTNPDSRIHGWNLIGNPFGTTATIDKDFYRMNDDHTEIIAALDNNIAPMEGVLVHATGSGQSVTFTTGGSKGGDRNTDNIVINLSRPSTGSGTDSTSTIIDRAIVSFDEGRTLPKFQIDENNTKIYIPQDGEDYAIAFSDKTGELPLHFVAKEIGRYTISVETHGLASLHVIKLIDNFENITIDLNENNNYTFIGSPADSRDRFVIVFVETQNFVSPQDDIFAYQNGSDIIVNGEGELQVFDVMGRIIMQKHVNGVEMVRKPSQSGVYIFRLNGKTQKIVIR